MITGESLDVFVANKQKVIEDDPSQPTKLDAGKDGGATADRDGGSGSGSASGSGSVMGSGGFIGIGTAQTTAGGGGGGGGGAKADGGIGSTAVSRGGVGLRKALSHRRTGSWGAAAMNKKRTDAEDANATLGRDEELHNMCLIFQFMKGASSITKC